MQDNNQILDALAERGLIQSLIVTADGMVSGEAYKKRRSYLLFRMKFYWNSLIL